jgi:cytochrome c556
MTKRLAAMVGAGIVAAALSATGISQAQTPAAPSPAQIIKARQAALDMSAITFAALKQAMESGADVSKFGYQAHALAGWAAALPTLFPTGTGEGQAGVDTKARPEIWSNRAGFEARAADYAATTAKLADFAKAGDAAGFASQLALVKKSCDACHTDFKER